MGHLEVWQTQRGVGQWTLFGPHAQDVQLSMQDSLLQLGNDGATSHFQEYLADYVGAFRLLRTGMPLERVVDALLAMEALNKALLLLDSTEYWAGLTGTTIGSTGVSLTEAALAEGFRRSLALDFALICTGTIVGAKLVAVAGTAVAGPMGGAVGGVAGGALGSIATILAKLGLERGLQSLSRSRAEGIRRASMNTVIEFYMGELADPAREALVGGRYPPTDCADRILEVNLMSMALVNGLYTDWYGKEGQLEILYQQCCTADADAVPEIMNRIAAEEGERDGIVARLIALLKESYAFLWTVAELSPDTQPLLHQRLADGISNMALQLFLLGENGVAEGVDGELTRFCDRGLQLYVSPYPLPEEATAVDPCIQPVEGMQPVAERTPLAPGGD